MIAMMILRFVIAVGITYNMAQIICKKIKDQFGMGVKVALLLIIESFDRYCICKNILNGKMTKSSNKIKTKQEYRKSLQSFNNHFGFPNNTEIDDKILDLMCSDFEHLNESRMIMSDDMENCLNGILREPSLRNIYKMVPGLYNISYACYSRPTKYVIKRAIFFVA